MSSFYQRLLAETEQARREFLATPALQLGSRGEIALRSYVAFLTEAYHHVKHTVPLLMACGARLPERLEWLRAGIGDYIEEEMGHQEWILGDLRACGVDDEAVRLDPPHPTTEVMVAYAYDYIQRHNPVGLFGMVLVLEGTSTHLASGAAQAIGRSLGLPSNAFRYLSSHGALDIGHMDFYRSLMDRLEREEDRRAVIHCARMFYRLYGDMFRSLPLEQAPVLTAVARKH
jgi:pyrroloquinoline quinone (PQQ) biosynthesis protein C